MKAAEENHLKLNKSEQDIESLSIELKAVRKEGKNLQIHVSDKLLEDINMILKIALDKGILQRG